MGTYPGGPKAMLQHERDTWGPGTRRGPGEDGSCGGPEAVGTRRGCDGAASRGGGTASWLLRARGRPGDTRGTQTGAARCGTAASKHRSGGAGVSGGVPEETGMDRRGSGGDRGDLPALGVSDSSAASSHPQPRSALIAPASSAPPPPGAGDGAVRSGAVRRGRPHHPHSAAPHRPRPQHRPSPPPLLSPPPAAADAAVQRSRPRR